MNKLSKHQIKTKPLLAIFLIAIICFASGALYAHATAPTLHATISGGPQPGAPTYTIFSDGGSPATYYAKDQYGAISWSSTNATTIWQNSINAVASKGGEIFVKNGVYDMTGTTGTHLLTLPTATSRDNAVNIIIRGESATWSSQTKQAGVIIRANPPTNGAVFYDGMSQGPPISYNEFTFYNIEVMNTYNASIRGSNAYAWCLANTGRAAFYNCIATTTVTQGTGDSIYYCNASLAATYGPMGFAATGDDGTLIFERCAVYNYYGGFPLTAHGTIIDCLTYSCAYPLVYVSGTQNGDHPTYINNLSVERYKYIINAGWINNPVGIYGTITYENSTDSTGILLDPSDVVYGKISLTGHYLMTNASLVNTSNWMGTNTGGTKLIVEYTYPFPETYYGWVNINSVDSQLLLHYTTNEAQGTSIYDSSGNCRTGTLVGVTWGQGKYGSGLVFDGTNKYVDCGLNTALGLTTEITVSAWVKLNTAISYAHIITARNGTTDSAMSWNLGFGSPANRPSFYVSNGTQTATATSADGVANGDWHFVVGTYDGANVCIYMDGTLRGSASLTGAINTVNTGNVYIGREFAGYPTVYINGTISDIRVYGRALNPSEVLYLSQQPTIL